MGNSTLTCVNTTISAHNRSKNININRVASNDITSSDCTNSNTSRVQNDIDNYAVSVELKLTSTFSSTMHAQ